jgi:lipopolysaccharide transport system ATP-binding protein
MTAPMITVSHLGKAFKRYARVRHRLFEWLPGGGQHHEQRWVLEDLNFSIRAGESVGLVGRNGAGKSTLLKLLTGTLMPTTGLVSTQGRVAALLELGMGFHPDQSGLDNVLIAGQLQGMTRQEVMTAINDIVAFAEIGDALSQPVRVYSSGMMVRLAFAVATAWRPDVLIVDEALAVGDAYFQHKCFKRIREFQQAGVSLLFVSHDPLAVKSLCNRALLIEGGKIAMDGNPVQVLDYYNALIALDEASIKSHQKHITALTDDGSVSVRSGTGQVRIKSVHLLRDGLEIKQAIEGEKLEICLELAVFEDLPSLTVGILLRDRLGNEIFGINTYSLGLANQLDNLKAGSRYCLKFSIVHLSLGVGSYALSVAAHGADSHLAGNFDWWDQAAIIQVMPGVGVPFEGAVRLPVDASILQLGA